MNMDTDNTVDLQDGIHGMVPKDKMSPAARKLRDIYDIVPGSPFPQQEFGFYSIEKWQAEEGMPTDVPRHELFQFDPGGSAGFGGLGWCEAAFLPQFETKVLEDRGEYELVQDHAGRHVLCFKGRRSGFMPEYVDHPVKDWKTWEEDVKWRMDPTSPERFEKLDEKLPGLKAAAAEGKIIDQGLIGGYMYLRSLMGPSDVLYKFYDMPDLIHDCMKTWFELSDTVIARHQEHLTLDQVFLAEDISYNSGPLISPDMMREFLFPYYKQLLDNVRARQIDKTRKLFVHIDTDGNCVPTIPVYKEIGVNVMSPFEVASGCDVVEIGKQFPELVMFGGVDKRELAKGREAIDKLVDRIFPAMQARGGYIPTCDHGVPEEVKYEDYLYYRKRCLEFA
jgi:hypothetical protein